MLTLGFNFFLSSDLHVLLLEDLLILLQKQDEKLVLKCLSSTFQAGYLNEKVTSCKTFSQFFLYSEF